MRDSGNRTAFILANLKNLRHEGNGIVLFKPLVHCLFEHRGSEGPKRFPSFDLRVKERLHVTAARITQDRSVTKGTRSPLHTSLKPADHFSSSDSRSGP